MTTVTVCVPLTIRKRGGRKMIISPDGVATAAGSRTPADIAITRGDPALVKALARAFRWVADAGDRSSLLGLRHRPPGEAQHILRQPGAATDAVCTRARRSNPGRATEARGDAAASDGARSSRMDSTALDGPGGGRLIGEAQLAGKPAAGIPPDPWVPQCRFASSSPPVPSSDRTLRERKAPMNAVSLL